MYLSPPGPQLASAIVFFSAAIWGIYWLPLHHLETLGITGTTSVALLSLPAILPLLFITGWQWKAHQGHMKKALLIGLLTGTGIALYSSGVIYSSVVRATLLFYLTPAWATLIEIFWMKEKVSPARWIAIAGGFAGMVLLLSGHDSAPLNTGDILAFLSGIFWAAGTALIKRYDHIPLPGILLGQFTFTVIISLLVGYFSLPWILPTVQQIYSALPVSFLVSIGLLLPSLLAICWAQKFIAPGRVSLLMMSEVLVAVLSASMLLPDEMMNLTEGLGAILIIGSCLAEIQSVKPSLSSA